MVIRLHICVFSICVPKQLKDLLPTQACAEVIFQRSVFSPLKCHTKENSSSLSAICMLPLFLKM